MITFSGTGVFDAVAIGKIKLVKQKKRIIAGDLISDVTAELTNFAQAKEVCLQQIEALYQTTCAEAGEEQAQIFQGHKMILEDVEYINSITSMIELQKVNAAYAVMQNADRLAKMFAMMDDANIQARAADVRDVTDRLLGVLTSSLRDELVTDEPCIICADDLSPSQTVLLDKENVLAFVTKYGAPSAHTAILARTMGIPAIVGCGDAYDKVIDGELAIVDGFTGTVYVSPDEKTLAELTKKQRKAESQTKKLYKLRGKDNVTIDGRRIELFANIASVSDVDMVLENDAGGIGLFRSEFLYLERDELPDEETQFEAYKAVLSRMGKRKVIIRTLDLGADKQIPYLPLDKEENPALGYRAIRICLTMPELFKTQLRALLRASVYGNLAILFPMIASVEEVIQIKKILDEVKSELLAEQIPFADDIEIGIMIETPAAALIADRLAQEVDFFSVGTNDLTQYTLALDRQNPRLEQFYDARHEAVIRLIRIAAHSAHKYGKKVGICGELAADPALTSTWIELGIAALSVAPTYVLGLRAHIRALDLSEQQKIN